MPRADRGFFESRLGADLGQVRIHTDAHAAATAESLNARAFTHGQDIAFGAGQYSPDTTPGRRLIAHELAHTIQQGRGAGDGRRIQRKMGFEFQTPRQIVKSGTAKKLTRKATKAKDIIPKTPSISSNLSMEVDESSRGSVIEFVTDAANEWAPLAKDIDNAVDIVDAIKSLPKKKNRKLNKKVWSGFKTNYGPLDIVVGKFTAATQSTEGITIDEFPSYLKEHLVERGTSKRQKQIAKKSLAAARKISLPKGRISAKLRGLLTLIVYYIKLLTRRAKKALTAFSSRLPKNLFRLMTRVDFVTLVRRLSKSDRKRFKELVRSGKIESEAGVKPKDPLLPHGYWVSYSSLYGKRRRFSHLLIMPLGKRSEVKGVWHPKKKYVGCTVAEFQAKEIKNYNRAFKKYCKRPPKKIGKKYPAITVRAWLNSMYKGTYKRRVTRKWEKKAKRRAVDLLSPLPGWGGGHKGGYGIGTWPSFGSVFAFENRVHKSVSYKKWKKWAKNEFTQAANRRARLKKP